MITINMPGFSADASLYSTSWNYVSAVTERGGAIHLAQFEDPVECKRCMGRCRQLCPRRFPSCFTDCVLADCSVVCGGIP
jgi:hypothetical protein